MPPRKNQTFSHQQNNWIVTDYVELKNPTALRREFRKHFKLSSLSASSLLLFLQSYQRIYGLRWRLFFQASRSSSNQNYRRKHWYSTVEEKPNSSISLASNSLPELVNNVERHAIRLNKDQIITAVNDSLPRTQACIESDGGEFEHKLKSVKNKLNSYFLIADIFCQMPDIRQYK